MATPKPDVTVRVHLQDSVSGLCAWHTERYPRHARSDWELLESAQFRWEDGNEACDCNRGICLANALALPDDHDLRALSCVGERVIVLEATIDGQPLDIR
jgi:hypothetical protein